MFRRLQGSRLDALLAEATESGNKKKTSGETGEKASQESSEG
jgi:hypothetical protein